MKKKKSSATAKKRRAPTSRRSKKATVPRTLHDLKSLTPPVVYELHEVKGSSDPAGGLFSGWLDAARYQWLSGDWSALATLEEHHLEHHPDRGKLALLAASAKAHTGQRSGAVVMGAKALEWGCPKRFAAQVLALATHRTLEKAARKALRTDLADRQRAASTRILQGQPGNPALPSAMNLASERPIFPPLVAAQRFPGQLSAARLDVKDAEPLQIIVLGMHRSGTSCLTGLIRSMGAFVGDENDLTGSNWENPKGFWERRDVRAICDNLLHAASADWDRVEDFEPSRIPAAVLDEQMCAFATVCAELDRAGIWVLKEPRLACLLPTLRMALSNPLVVHIYRYPLETALSLAKRNKLPIPKGLQLWESYNRSILEASADMPSLRVSYERLVADPLSFCRTFVGALPATVASRLTVPSSDQVYRSVDPRLYRQRAKHDPSDEKISAAQKQLWTLLETGRS